MQIGREKVIGYVVAIATWCISIVAEADTGHVIVAFDRAIPNYESTYRSMRTLVYIDDFIKKMQFDELFLSVVGYSMNGDNPSIDNFVVPYTDGNGLPVLWHRYDSLCSIFPHWPIGEPREMNLHGRPASMQSLAKPYCVMETVVKDEEHVADATFVIFVTDEVVQGIDDDYTGEWKKMSWYNPNAYLKIQDNVFKKLQQFNETYRFELRNRETINEKFVMASYELLPAEQPSIYSVSDLPSPLPVRRIRGGYILACQVKSQYDRYKVEDWAVYGCFGRPFKRNKEGAVFIKSSDLKEGDTLEIRMSMRLSDDLYGAFLLSHKNCAGMAQKQVVKLQDEAKVLGVMPLSDFFWWWSPNDVLSAVIIWDLLILLALIVIAVSVFYVIFVVINNYHPNNKDIRLTKK